MLVETPKESGNSEKTKEKNETILHSTILSSLSTVCSMLLLLLFFVFCFYWLLGKSVKKALPPPNGMECVSRDVLFVLHNWKNKHFVFHTKFKLNMLVYGCNVIKIWKLSMGMSTFARHCKLKDT